MAFDAAACWSLPLVRNQGWPGACAVTDAPDAVRKLWQLSAPNPRKSCSALLWPKGLCQARPPSDDSLPNRNPSAIGSQPTFSEVRFELIANSRAGPLASVGWTAARLCRVGRQTMECGQTTPPKGNDYCFMELSGQSGSTRSARASRSGSVHRARASGEVLKMNLVSECFLRGLLLPLEQV